MSFSINLLSILMAVLFSCHTMSIKYPIVIYKIPLVRYTVVCPVHSVLNEALL
uniref:Uncharacterized protein n=1 Tax=Lepeophtheirus salmonis TaxID=72036 RepID=A0A0K2VHI7_LEPSM